VIEDDEEEKEE